MDSLDQILDNLWTSDYVQANPNKSYKNQYNAEYGAISAYITGGTRPDPKNYSKMGKTLVGLEDQRRAAETPVPEPEPPTGNPYYKLDFSDGKYAPYTSSVFSAYGSDPLFAPGDGVVGSAQWDSSGKSTDKSKRVSIQQNIVGKPASRHELRLSDTPWRTSATGLDKSSYKIPGVAETFGPGGFQLGAVRWFRYDYLLPKNLNGDSFAASMGWHTLMDLHETTTEGSQSWNVFDIGYIQGGKMGSRIEVPGDSDWVPYFDLADTSMYNKWHTLIIGAKFVKDNTGWVEVWHDGTQLAKLTNRRTLLLNSSGVYMQAQNYKKHGEAFQGGAQNSVIYHGGMRAGMTKADVS